MHDEEKTKDSAPATFFRRVNMVVDQDVTSWSGKYQLLYGKHYRAGFLCFDIAVLNGVTGEVVRRHYWSKSGNEPGCCGPEAEAQCLAFWNEFATQMIRPPEGEEEIDERRKDRYWTIDPNRKPN